MPKQDFAAVLLAARKGSGLTQAELAQAAGLTPSYLCTIEKRRKPPPSDDVCRRLAQVLGIPAQRLLEVAHLERAPEALRRKVRSLGRSLKRERHSRLRVLRTLLSPFLFSGPPGYAESALGTLGLSRARQRRIREVLDAVGRRNLDREREISKLIEDLPERERSVLLDALPRVLAERRQRAAATDAAEPTGPTEPAGPPGAGTDERAAPPPAGQAGRPVPPTGPEGLSYRPGSGGPGDRGPWLLDVDARLADGLREPAVGDRIVVDATLAPEAGDLVVLRGEEGPVLRRLERDGTMLRLATDRPPAVPPVDDAVPPVLDPESAGAADDDAPPHPSRPLPADAIDRESFEDLWRVLGQGVVTEVRRPLRQRRAGRSR